MKIRSLIHRSKILKLILASLFQLFYFFNNKKKIKIYFNNNFWLHECFAGKFANMHPVMKVEHHLLHLLPIHYKYYKPKLNDVIFDIGAGTGENLIYSSKLIRAFILFYFVSSSVLAQGNLGINFGLNDDNFGSIKNIDNKIDNYNIDIKNSTGFQIGVFTEIDLITFYIRPELNLIFSKSKNASAYSIQSNGSSILNQSINIAEHSFKSTDIQVPIIFGYKVFGPISLFAGPTFKYSLSSSSNFDLEDINDKYTLSILLGARVKIRSISMGLRYERGLNSNEVLIINANGVDLNEANVDLTTNKLSLNISYDIPYNLFKKKKS